MSESAKDRIFNSVDKFAAAAEAVRVVKERIHTIGHRPPVFEVTPQERKAFLEAIDWSVYQLDALLSEIEQAKEEHHGAELAAGVNDTGRSETETASDWRRELLKSGDEKKRAAAIYAAVEAACEKAKKVRRKDRTRFEHDGINWADLGCSGVEVSAHFYGDDGWEFSCTAYVEEASPDCRELPTFVEQELVSAGFTDVRVVTEW